MLFHLIKKDFLIVKKYVLIVLVAAILIPPVMRWRTTRVCWNFWFYPFRDFFGFYAASIRISERVSIS